MAAEATSPAERETPPPIPGDRIARPIGFTEEDLAAIRFSADGLVPAVVQDASDGEVLMLGYMDVEALRRTLSTGRSWFWSRSRQNYWCKGETSGDRQWVRAVRYDCDGDTLLVVVDQDGHGACHTGARSCFYRSFGARDTGDADRAAPALG
jgi:phosphoribosyl-AMP cyclohydrolase